MSQCLTKIKQIEQQTKKMYLGSRGEYSVDKKFGKSLGCVCVWLSGCLSGCVLNHISGFVGVFKQCVVLTICLTGELLLVQCGTLWVYCPFHAQISKEFLDLGTGSLSTFNIVKTLPGVCLSSLGFLNSKSPKAHLSPILLMS